MSSEHGRACEDL